MLTSQKLKELKLDNNTDYYELIIDHISNDRIIEARSLYKELNRLQKERFADWFSVAMEYEAQDNDTSVLVEYCNMSYANLNN